jgi:hypothetical protein
MAYPQQTPLHKHAFVRMLTDPCCVLLLRCCACWFCSLQVAELQQMPPLHEQLLDGFLAGVHQTMTAMEPLRVMAGAGSNTRDSPANVTDYRPSEADVGGWFDDNGRAQRAYAAKQQQAKQQQQQVVQLQVQQLQDPQQQQQQQQNAVFSGTGGSAASLAAAVAAAEAEARQQGDASESSEAAAASSSSGGGRRWRLRRQRST